MDFFDVINNRYTYRGEFLETPIPKENIEKILSSALKAPTAMNVQTTHFVAITNKEIIKQIGELMPQNGTSTAPLVV
ncbi:MAG: nitroreductase family protein, partial [Oscillospiraceae bacterium]